MEVWQVILYGVAALYALRSLTGLATAYRDRLLKEQAAQAEAERRAARKAAAPADSAPNPRQAA